MKSGRLSGLVRYGMAAALACAGAGGVQAHHSAAPYDHNKVTRVAGTVAMIRYANPHILLKLTTPKGVYAIEGSSVNQLARKGWSRTTLKPGDKVNVEIWPLRNGSPGGFMIGIRLANGKVLA